MAIKGKGKTRGGRPVAPAPRPIVVTRKPVVWKRRPVWITALVLVALGIGIGIFAAVHAASHRSFLAREKRAISAYSDQVVAKVPTDAQSAGGGTVFLFPNAGSELDELASGKADAAASLTQAKKYAAEA